MSLVLFWVALVAGICFVALALYEDHLKPYFVAFPFFLLLASAVAKYLGM